MPFYSKFTIKDEVTPIIPPIIKETESMRG